MPKVTFLPMDQTVETPEGETILETALSHDIPLQHACGGFCSCTTCQILVKKNPEALEPMEEDEEERLESTGKLEPQSRLGCQSKVTGDVTVEIVNLDE